MKKSLITVFLMSFAMTAHAADDVYNTVTANTVSSAGTSSQSVGLKAKDWNLTDSEWVKYTNLMSGQAGYYFKDYTPPEVLAMYSENETELRHFSEVAASIEHQMVEKELKLNNAFHDAVIRLYPQEPIIKPFDVSSFSPNAGYTPVN